MKKIVRSFNVKAEAEHSVESIGYSLDLKLLELQQNGWEILNVFEEKCKVHNDYSRTCFDSVVFVIVVQREVSEEQEKELLSNEICN